MADTNETFQTSVNELASDTHDSLTGAGCDCEYIVSVSWQRSTVETPLFRILHSPLCPLVQLPTAQPEQQEAEDAEPVEDKQPAPAKRTRKKAAAKSKSDAADGPPDGDADGDREPSEQE